MILDEGDDDGLAEHVARVLHLVWDPIGISGLGPEDEYDAYVPDLIALTRDTTAFEDALAAHLAWIEVEAMHLSLPPTKRTRAARALLGLREAIQRKPGRLIEQWSNPDGLRCAWVFETPGGLYTFDEGVLRHENDGNGLWSHWDYTSLGRHGMYDTAGAAEREARAAIGWLSGDLAASESVAVPWSDAFDWRPLEPRERAVLDRLLTAEFPGRDRLAAQARTALVRQIDDEGSLRFRVEGAPAVVTGRVPAEGSYQDGDDPFGSRVNLLLHVVGGRLHELEVFKDDSMSIRLGPFEVALDRITVWPD